MNRADTPRRLFMAIIMQTRPMIIAMSCLVIVTAIDSGILMGIKYLIDDALTKKNMHILNILALTVIGIYIIRIFFVFGRVYFAGLLGQRIIEKLRNEIYTHINKLSMGFFDKSSTGLLMSRVTNDMVQVQFFVTNGLTGMLEVVCSIIFCLILLIVTSWKLTIVSMVALPLVAYFISLMGNKMRNVQHYIQKRIADLTDILQETISGIRIVKSFTMEDQEIERFRKENSANVRAALKGFRILGLTRPTIEVMGAVGLMGVIYVGGRLVLSDAMTAGKLTSFLFLLAKIFNEAKHIGEQMLTLNSALASSDRLYEILDLETEYDSEDGAADMPHIRGQVTFENVTLAYKPDEDVLKDIDIEVRPGEIIALVGPSGAGKTSIVNLIPRFYRPIGGRILIDGIDISTVKIKTLRGQIGIVPQETLLFSCSIGENIAYGRTGATEREIIEAARAANAENFINALPEGYKTLCGERGVSLSGGERQRVAIARAILRDPRILILDEATSSLDTASERLVQEALDRLMKDRTTFVIAHRLSTILNANRILVMAGGRIVETGTHQELYNLRGLYKQLYDLQFENQNLNKNPVDPKDQEFLEAQNG